jgi:hypothetical protein
MQAKQILAFVTLLALATGCIQTTQTTTTTLKKSNVILSVDPASYCSRDEIVVYLKNDGTEASDSVTIVAFKPDGSKEGECTIASIGAGSIESCSITRSPASPSGMYSITATTSGSSVRASLYCPF